MSPLWRSHAFVKYFLCFLFSALVMMFIYCKYRSTGANLIVKDITLPSNEVINFHCFYAFFARSTSG